MALFDGKVALVTGASSGIGRETAILYAKEGARVVVSDISESGGNETVQMIRAAQGDAFFIRADVAQPEDCRKLVADTLTHYGRLDVAFNNAGIGGEANPVADLSVEGWQKVIAINLSGVFYGMKYQIPAILKSGGGAIVNMSSILGAVAFEGSSAYVASKHGVIGLTQTAALEYSAQGVRVNVVGPAFIHTPMLAAIEEDKATTDMLVSRHPIGRLGRSEEVAELVIWLSSEKASFVTGAYYPVDGGYLAR